jgi:hypothetical protein
MERCSANASDGEVRPLLPEASVLIRIALSLLLMEARTMKVTSGAEGTAWLSPSAAHAESAESLLAVGTHPTPHQGDRLIPLPSSSFRISVIPGPRPQSRSFDDEQCDVDNGVRLRESGPWAQLAPAPGSGSDVQPYLALHRRVPASMRAPHSSARASFGSARCKYCARFSLMKASVHVPPLRA